MVLLSLIALTSVGCFLDGSRNLAGTQRGWSPVAAAEGMVYVGTIDGQVLALQDGSSSVSLKWSFPTGGEETIGGVYSNPVVGSDLVYVSGLNGTLYALDKETGRADGLGWSKEVSSDGGTPAGLVGSPALSKDRSNVIVGSQDGKLYAYSATTGELLNGFPFVAGDKIWSTPVVGEDGTIYFGSHDRNIYAVNLDGGSLKWSRPFPTGGAVVAQPLLFENLVVVGSFDKKLYALSTNSGTQEWGGEARVGLPEFEGGSNWFWAGAVASSSTIYASDMDGTIYAIDGDGNLKWEEHLDGPIVSTPVLLPFALVVATKEGKLHRIDPQNGLSKSNPLRLPSEVRAPLSVPPPTPVYVPEPTPAVRDRFRPEPTPTPSYLETQQADQSDSVYLGTQEGVVYRIQLSGGENQRIVWCFNTEQKEQLPISECSSANE